MRKALKPHPRGKIITQALVETYETVLITQIFDDVLIQKGISNTPLVAFASKTIIFTQFCRIKGCSGEGCPLPTNNFRKT